MFKLYKYLFLFFYINLYITFKTTIFNNFIHHIPFLKVRVIGFEPMILVPKTKALPLGYTHNFEDKGI